MKVSRSPPDSRSRVLRVLSAEESVSRIDELLEARFASADLGNKADPLDELVYILLSIQTQAAGYNRAYQDLRRLYPTWRKVMEAPSADLMRVLEPSGLALQKAPRL